MSKSTLLALFLLLPHLGFADSISTPMDYLSRDSIISESSNKDLWNNWFISVGTNMPEAQNASSPITPQNEELIDEALNQWGDSKVGVRSMYSTLSIKGISWNSARMDQKKYDKSASDHFNQLKLHADILFNASNLIFDYKEKHVWTLLSTSHQNLRQENKLQKSPVDINLNIEGTYVGFKAEKALPQINDFKNVSATLGFTFHDQSAKTKRIEFPIGSSEHWNEHCSRMMYIDTEE